jgi:hypothetical protein|tara:strand:+ start:17538 stop:18002 length:465 start_codon:yes stop_codon:yes gene_type:complete
MPTFYTRQSAAEIVDGQVADASDFNDEFGAIVTGFANVSSYVDSWFTGTTSGGGHTHTGTADDGPLIILTGTAAVTGVTGVLAPQFGGLHSIGADPTVNDDTPNYQVGGMWVNTTTDKIYVCVDNTNGGAIWSEVSHSAAVDEGQLALFSEIIL